MDEAMESVEGSALTSAQTDGGLIAFANWDRGWDSYANGFPSTSKF